MNVPCCPFTYTGRSRRHPTLPTSSSTLLCSLRNFPSSSVLFVHLDHSLSRFHCRLSIPEAGHDFTCRRTVIPSNHADLKQPSRCVYCENTRHIHPDNCFRFVCALPHAVTPLRRTSYQANNHSRPHRPHLTSDTVPEPVNSLETPIRVIAALVVGVTILLSTRIWTGLKYQDACSQTGEKKAVPVVPSSIPFIGHALQLLWDVDSFLRRVR